MTKIVRKENLLVEARFVWAGVFILTLTSLLTVRLWYVQIYMGDHYQRISENNRIRRIEIPAPRGVIYDRHGQVVLGNRPFFDLAYIPQYITDKDITLELLSRLLHVPIATLERRLRIGSGRPRYLPIILRRNLSIHEVSVIESNKVFLPGIEVRVAPRREYLPGVPSHLVGYLSEIDQQSLDRLNRDYPDRRYQPGDLIGRQGLESRWEPYLRGNRGYRLIQVDAFGRQTAQNVDLDWQLPTVEAEPGHDLELTLDLELQQVAREAFLGKYGAVIALDPRSGEILAMLSSPGYDPNIFQQGVSREEWRSLLTNPFIPLYDKTTGGEYPPGSVYKAVIAMAAMEERVVNENTKVNCPGHFTLGDQTFRCHNRSGHGSINMRQAMQKSCDVFFYQIGVELGVERIAHYARALGLGERLGVNLNTEKPGLVPTAAWKRLVHRMPWTPGDTPNIAIGQGFNLITPIQMANLYATLANGGTIWRPFLVRRITNHIGEPVIEHQSEVLSTVEGVSKQTFAYVNDILKDVVMHRDGTGRRAEVEGTTVAGKTGSVQVVSLQRNRNQTDVSMLWQEHAMFAAFAPVENAEIAVAVISEHDREGGGGVAAAPVAGRIIAAYFQLKEQRAKRVARANEADNEATRSMQ